MTLHDLILTLHILGGGVLIGIVFFALVLTLRPPISPEKLKTYGLIGSFGKYAAGWQLLTGLYLAWQNWDTLKSLPIFWVKIGLFVVAGILSGEIIRRKVKAALITGDVQAAKALPWLSIIFALVVIAIVSIGVFLVEHH